MALVDVAAREIRAKIVYYGPTLGGKTTNLRYIYDHLPLSAKGEFQAITADSARTLFFDYLPIDLGTILGFAIRFNLYTVAGQPNLSGARSAVMKGMDGIVFVADAQRTRIDDNLDSLRELESIAAVSADGAQRKPVVFQYNKMDLADAVAAAELDARLNPASVPRFEASALSGRGVFETLEAACRLVAQSL